MFIIQFLFVIVAQFTSKFMQKLSNFCKRNLRYSVFIENASVNVGMNCSDDLIRYVEGENYEKTVKNFEIVRGVIKGTFTPFVGMIGLDSNFLFTDFLQVFVWTDLVKSEASEKLTIRDEIQSF